MTWQKCPICNGTGLCPDETLMVQHACTVCKGQKIISTLTGLPPENAVVEPEMSLEEIIENTPVSNLEDLFKGFGDSNEPIGAIDKGWAKTKIDELKANKKIDEAQMKRLTELVDSDSFAQRSLAVNIIISAIKADPQLA